MTPGDSTQHLAPAEADPLKAVYRSPVRLFRIVALTILAMELLVMLVLHQLPALQWYAVYVLDAFALTILLLPVLYVFLFRPLNMHIDELRQMSELLMQQRDHLEELVQSRTADLVARNLEIADREVHYRAVVEGATEGILTLDQQANILRINAAAEKMFGYQHDETVGQPIATLLTAASAEQCFGPDGSPRTGSELSLDGRKKNGETLPVMLTLSVFLHENEPYYTAIIQNISARVMLEKRLAQLAYYDSLTGLPNRRLFHDRLGRALTRAKRNEKLVAIMFLDLDHFKNINDTLGHHFGDLLLQESAKRLTALIREDDTVARLGGDEFTVVLENISVVTEAETVAGKILQALSQPVYLGTQEIYVTASIGITYYPLDDNDIEKLIMNADSAMYQAKVHGRNTYELYTARLRSEATQRLSMDIALRKAISATDFLLHYQPEFILHYQPEIDRYTGEVVGVEALVRWQHPELGLLGPDSFIPLSEETGLIIAIGEWVIRTACKQVMSWRAAGLPIFNVAVNVSALQLQNRDIIDKIARILEETGLEARYLELELTESLILNKTDEFITILRDLKAMGITLTIDDFGTGHSSLANLQLLPIDKVKIDRSFVNNITTNEQDATIAVTVIEMAHKLGIKVVAEGVETEEQLMYLYAHHCDIMQGYHFSRPMVAEDFETLLATGVELGPLNAL